MKYFSVFSGVGGFEIGIQDAYENNNERKHIGKKSKQKNSEQGGVGISVQPEEVLCDSDRSAPLCVGFSEIDKYASQVLKYHYPETKNYGDITKIQWSEVPDFDLLVGGSPCQDFSIAGKRKGILGERSGLVWEFIRCLEEKKPRYFIWENVKGVMSSRRGYDFANIITAFSEVGYNLWWQVLNAKDFGVPQNRERIFVCGFRGESPREVFFERESDKNDNELVYHQKADKEIARIYKPSGIAPTQHLKTGGWQETKIAIPVLTPNRPIKRQNGRRMKTNGEPSFTLNTQDKHGIFNGSRIRRLTPTECERLMSWPDNWTKWGINEKGEKVEMSDTQRYKMCGNGVVSKVVEEIFKTLF